MTNNRFNYRLPITGPIKLEQAGQIISGQLVDISLSGLGCELQAQPFDAALYLISFELPPHIHLTTWIKPIWSIKSIDGYRTGFEFTDLDSAHHRQIADYLSQTWQTRHHV